ncbi:Elongator complex protein 2 [Penicillium chermesinum]|nr:Elongator complex protein 2 [Penicillium chermesinum]
MASVTTDYISVGGNRHPGAADWDVATGVVAFGADNNVALWEPLDPSNRGVYALLVGHSTKLPWSGSTPAPPPATYSHAATLEGHSGSINTIAVAGGSDIVVSGGADGTVRVWRIKAQAELECSLLETITMKPRFFPLALALNVLAGGSLVFAVAGTTTSVQIFVSEKPKDKTHFQRRAILSGHEAWVRSLAFALDKQNKTGDILLASASQDKYIRLWRLRQGEASTPAPIDDADPLLGGMEPTLSNKAHEFEASGSKYSLTFEALLFGNEDWIYTTVWNPDPTRSQLLSASADNTVTIWEQDTASGVWMSMRKNGRNQCTERIDHSYRKYGWLLERTVVARWQAGAGCKRLEYLVTADQTTRLHAEWLRDGKRSWHEFSRPQIHGYDLNCIDTLGSSQFVSGADEKLLRVFNEPKQIAALLEQLSGFKQQSAGSELPDTAEIPVLGLSNKAQGDEAPVEEGEPNDAASVPTPAVSLSLDRPPLEDQLARYTLWPEHEKLYGHGYEISAVAVSHDRKLIATACKASSVDHAVIRLYDTSDWHEIKPSLTAHSLTITDLAFSGDDKYLLSVGRDRQWALFSRSDQDPNIFSSYSSNPKGHSRMILGAAWAPSADKRVLPPLDAIISAVAILPSPYKNSFVLAAGEDSGALSIHGIALESLEAQHMVTLDQAVAPSRAITQLSWRPVSTFDGEAKARFELGVASEDNSVRIYAISMPMGL